MRIDKGTVNGVQLVLYCPATFKEFKKGTSLVTLQPGDGLLFDAHEYLTLYRINHTEFGQLPPLEQPINLPIAVGSTAQRLDVCWIDRDGMIMGIAHDHRGVLSAPCHYVLELAAGEAYRLGIDIGKRLVIESGSLNHGN